MPWLMIYSADPADPRDIAADWADRGTYETVGDGWIGTLDDNGQAAAEPTDPEQAARAKHRARQARYRDRKRGDRPSPRDAGDGQRDAGDASPRDAGDAKILKIERGITPPSPEGGGVIAPRVTRHSDAGDASRVTRKGDARGDADRTDRTENWRGDFAPLTPEERETARAGLAGVRDALRNRQAR